MILVPVVARCNRFTQRFVPYTAALLVLTALTKVSDCVAVGTGEVAESPTSKHGVNIAYIDRSIQPTNDFYNFANGAWLKTATIPDYANEAGVGVESSLRVSDIVEKLVKNAAENAANGKAVPGSSEQKVGDFYRVIADENLANKVGITPLQPELDRIAAIVDAKGVMQAMARLRRRGVRAGFSMSVSADDKDSKRNIAQLYQGGLTLPDRDYYLKTDDASVTIRKKYTDHIIRLLTLLGDTPTDAATKSTQILAIETRLAKASRTGVELRDPQSNYNKMTLKQLKATAPAPWDTYFTTIGKVDPGEINVGQPGFFTEFAKMISDVPVEQWKTYLKYQLVHVSAYKLSKPFAYEYFLYMSDLTGQKAMFPREAQASVSTNEAFGEAIGQLYTAANFSPNAKAKALALVTNIKAALSARIETLDWMSDATKVQARHKLNTLSVKVGYPDKWNDYSKLDIKADSWIANDARVREFKFQRSLEQIGKPVDRSAWAMTPTTVNAYYDTNANEIVFPAAILQPPLFDPEADDASNYGAIGAVIGHEMTHGFDNQGRQFNADGNLKDWWTPEDAKRFDERCTTLVKQYDAYEPLPGSHINGKLTLGENIADLGGLKIAYLAYKKSLNGKEPPKVDGFTGEQRFFLAYAQAWRNKSRPESLKLSLSSDFHSPDEYRVRGVLANMPEFWQAFGGSIKTETNAAIW